MALHLFDICFFIHFRGDLKFRISDTLVPKGFQEEGFRDPFSSDFKVSGEMRRKALGYVEVMEYKVRVCFIFWFKLMSPLQSSNNEVLLMVCCDKCRQDVPVGFWKVLETEEWTWLDYSETWIQHPRTYIYCLRCLRKRTDVAHSGG